jgi:hypothetical protein
LAWLKAVASIARVGTTFAGDFAQRIYRRHFTWKAAEIELPPARSKFLTGTHRNPKAIIELAKKVLGETDDAGDLGFESPVTTGTEDDGQEHKVLIQHPKVREARRLALARAMKLFESKRDVVVAVPFKRMLEESLKTIQELGGHAAALDGEELAGRNGTLLPITTFHQMKGMECEDIILLGMEDDLYPGWYLKGLNGTEATDKIAELRNLLYMAITRAKWSVTLCVGGDAGRFLKGGI